MRHSDLHHSPLHAAPYRGASHSPSNDEELLLRSATGDPSAFEVLFRRHRTGLLGFLVRRLRSQEEAEDALVVTFCKAWRAREAFRGNASGKAWLYQIATRVALDAIRRRRPAAHDLEKLAELGRGWDEEVVDPESVLLDGERTEAARTAVRDALGRLVPEDRKLVRLFYFDGYNYEEISSLLGVTRSQVRGRLHRIRIRMRRDLEQRQEWQSLAA